jgi:5'-3' exoribonuclease 1
MGRSKSGRLSSRFRSSTKRGYLVQCHVCTFPSYDCTYLMPYLVGREHHLTKEEQKRNTFGTSYQFRYNPGEPTLIRSSLPGFFPDLPRCNCIMEPFDLPTLDGLHLVQGLCEGVFLGSEALAGFPLLRCCRILRR